MAHTKAQGSVAGNRDSRPKNLGVKLFGGQKAKSRYRKVYGHRQELTRVKIESIGKKSSTKAVKSETTKEVKTQNSSIRQAQDKKVKSSSKK